MIRRMISCFSTIALSIGVLGWSNSISAKIPIDPVEKHYPYGVVTPSNVVDGNQVYFQWVLGIENNSCIKEYFTKISTIALDGEPYVYRHILNFGSPKRISDNLDCDQIPTEYGPTFKLGELKAGRHEIHLSDSIVMTFNVGESPAIAVTSQRLLSCFPVHPLEGETLKIRLKINNCSGDIPEYVTLYEMTQGLDNNYICRLSYKEKNNATKECTGDSMIPDGPEWIIPEIKSGVYQFELNDNTYLKVIVSKRPQALEFLNVTIDGMVNLGNVSSANQNIPVPQCTVTIVAYAVDTTIYFDPATGISDSAVTNETIYQRKYYIREYYAITDNNGRFSIGNVPVEKLTERTGLAAKKGSWIGYVAIEQPLTETMKYSITMYDYSTTSESNKIKDSKILIDKLNEHNKSTLVHKRFVENGQIMSVRALGNGFQLVNKTAQPVTLQVFSLNGKNIWSKTIGLHPAGIQAYTIPGANGMVLLKVTSSTFNKTTTLNMSGN